MCIVCIAQEKVEKDEQHTQMMERNVYCVEQDIA